MPMAGEKREVIFDENDKGFRCPRCGFWLSYCIHRGQITRSKAGDNRAYSTQATLAPAYCPNCLLHLDWDEAIGNVAEYVPEFRWEAMPEDYLQGQYNPDVNWRLLAYGDKKEIEPAMPWKEFNSMWKATDT